MSGVWTGWMRRLRKGEESGESAADGQEPHASEATADEAPQEHDEQEMAHSAMNPADEEPPVTSSAHNWGKSAVFVAKTVHDGELQEEAGEQDNDMQEPEAYEPEEDAFALNDGEVDEAEVSQEFDIAEQAHAVEQQAETGAEPAPLARKRRRMAQPAGKPASARQLLAQGMLPEARAAAEASIMDRRLANRIASIDAGEHLLETLGLNAKGVSSSILQGIMLAPSTGARQLIIVFGEDNGQFALPHTLEAGRMPHILYVRDRLNCLALQGVPRLGANYDECLVTILRIAKALEARTLFCVGAGSAMYSALRYGLDLGAYGVLALGTLERLQAGETVPGTRPPRYTVRMQQTAQRLGADLGLAYSKAAERPGLILCRPVSAMGSVEGLAAIPRIPITRAPAAASESLLAWADQSGKLRSLVRDLLASKPVEKRAAKKKPATPTGNTSP